MNKGSVARIINFSPVDGPGNRMVVFLQGCNFNCLYCHNPETISLTGSPEMTVQDIVKRYLKAKPYISGVTFSGGECTVQFEFLLDICTALKSLGAHILIDTNGQIGEDELKRLYAVTDGLLLDIKAIDPEEHRILTGVGNEQVLRTFQSALRMGRLAEVRTVIRGGVADALDTVAWVSRKLAAADPDIPYRIIRYRSNGVKKEMLSALQHPNEGLMAQCRAIAEDAGLKRVIVV